MCVCNQLKKLKFFPADHYQGLSKHFNCGTIYCSITTARLAHRNIGIPTSCFKTLPLNEFVEINGVRVAFIDANHCPGAVMILFVLSNGKSYLHVGKSICCHLFVSSKVEKGTTQVISAGMRS